MLCGAKQCSGWLYRKTTEGYELLLEAHVGDIVLRRAVTNGYRDVGIQYMGGFNYPPSEEIYKFDGRRYQKWSQRDVR